MYNKPVESFANRLRQALSVRNMTQSELCKRTNIASSMMSEYLKGKYEPKQDKVYLLSQALNVDPAWLMGFDIPMAEEKKDSPTEVQLSEGEKILLDLFKRVPEDQQQLVLQMIRAALGSRE